MSELVRSGTVHWVGTGLSTGRGLGLVADAARETIIWGRTAAKAAACADRLGLAGRVAARELSDAAFEQALRPGDVVVSMLPATEHPALAEHSLRAGAHFACTSYLSPQLHRIAGRAGERGLAVLAEDGLDPGIDHLLAHVLVDEATAAVGDGPASVRFTSYCGGIPVTANAFRYRFSWAPRGVLHALREPARYVSAGEIREAPRPWEHTRSLGERGETFEVYPNRDSLPFIAQYGLPERWRTDEFVRGTLRLDGWRAAWQPVFEQLRTGDDEAIDAMADKLAAEYPAGPRDLDRVVLIVALAVTADDGGSFSGRFVLDVAGDEHESAMARCVSLPLAVGIRRILDGQLPAGLTRAADNGRDAQAQLGTLAAVGLPVIRD
ncbi:saccharopine dehydrogenase C-terminal domain-containing protein [Actinoplanes sp. HUAS TT8]|uniref:saccharopine dehydrogenase C-terminal domain-containing protein n=1 Tax=Actinoplanes sp. HUAS TT8 TaxID=3447453 RepID=UPI003F51CF5E